VLVMLRGYANVKSCCELSTRFGIK